MGREKLLGYVEAVALLQVVLAACLWLLPDWRVMACAWMSVATVLLAVGRFLQKPFYEKYAVTDPRELTMRRLYHQRVFGFVGLMLSALFMWLPVGFYAGMFVGRTAWLIPFVFFVVVEVYTVFRVSAIEKTKD